MGLLIIAGGSAKKIIDKQIKLMEKDIREKEMWKFILPEEKINRNTQVV